MPLSFKLNIAKIKKAASIVSVAFVLVISVVILLNVYKSANDTQISTGQEFLKHLISDHSVNNVNFKFIKLEPAPQEYFDNISATAQTISIPFALFILSSIIITYFPKREKISYAEIFLFTDGFKSSPFRPPKY